MGLSSRQVEPTVFARISSWHFDIDRYLNPIIPAPRWNVVPAPIAHFLGHRDEAPKPLGNIVRAFWSLIGAFCGVALVASVSKRVSSIDVRDAPVIVGSFVSISHDNTQHAM